MRTTKIMKKLSKHIVAVNNFDVNGRNKLEVARIVAVGSSGILKAKQKLGVTFNFDKQDVIDFMKFSKMTMCKASEAIS